MAVTNVHIWYPGGGATAYDLRKVESWSNDSDDASYVRVRFISGLDTAIRFPKATFEAAKQASIDAEP